MPRTRLICAFGLVLWSGAAQGQLAPSAALSDDLRAHLKAERFDVVTSIRGLPLGMRDELQKLWRSQTLDIADPGAAFQGGAPTANPSVPTRRLAVAGCAPDHHCLVYYERGGPTPLWRLALFQWAPAATRFEAGGGSAAGLKTLDEVRGALLSGALAQTSDW